MEVDELKEVTSARRAQWIVRTIFRQSLRQLAPSPTKNSIIGSPSASTAQFAKTGNCLFQVRDFFLKTVLFLLTKHYVFGFIAYHTFYVILVS